MLLLQTMTDVISYHDNEVRKFLFSFTAANVPLNDPWYLSNAQGITCAGLGTNKISLPFTEG
jgi:hypothetical protein